MWYKSTPACDAVFIETVVGHSNDELRLALAAAHAVARSNWSIAPVARRVAILERLASRMETEADDFVALLARDRLDGAIDAQDEARLCIEILRYYAREASRMLAPADAMTSTGPVRIEHIPIGVVLAESAAHSSFYRVVRMIGCNVAVGNAVLFRHVSRISEAATMIQALLAASGAPQGAWTGVLASKMQWTSLATDNRVGAIAVAGGRSARLTGDSEHPRKPRIHDANPDLFAVPDDTEASSAWAKVTLPMSHNLLASFTATLIDQPVVASRSDAGSPTPDTEPASGVDLRGWTRG